MKWRVKGTIKFRSEVEVDRVFEAKTRDEALEAATEWAQDRGDNDYDDDDCEAEPEDPAEKATYDAADAARKAGPFGQGGRWLRWTDGGHHHDGLLGWAADGCACRAGANA